MRTLLLALILPLLLLAAPASAASGPESLSYGGNGSTTFTWAPFADVELGVSFRINEVHPDATRPEGNVWRSPTQVQPFAPAQSGTQLELDQVYAWTLPGRTGNIKVSRRPESFDGRLVIRDSWTCEPTEAAFFTYEFAIDLNRCPEATLELVGGPAGSAPGTPRLADLMLIRSGHFTNGMDVLVSGVRIGGINKGVIKLSLPQELQLSLHFNTKRNEARLRFMAPPPRETLVSGETIMTLEWTPVNR